MDIEDEVIGAIRQHYRELYDEGKIEFYENAEHRGAEYVVVDKSKHGIWISRLLDDISKVIKRHSFEFVIRGKKLIIFEV